MKKKSLFVIVYLCLCASFVHADDFLLTQGALIARVWYFAASANNVFAKDGTSSPIIPGLDDHPYAERSIVAFAQYGLSEKLTLFASVPMRRIFVHDSSYQHISTGLADVTVGATYKLFDNFVVTSVTGMVNVPTPYPRDYAPPLGAGQVDIAVAANASRKFDPVPADAQVSLGFRMRTGLYTSSVSSNPMLNADFTDNASYANELFWSLEGGWTFFDQLRVHASLRGLASMRSDGSTWTINRIPTTQSWNKLGGGVSFKLMTHYQVFADMYSTISGGNTAGTIDILLGAGVEF